MRHAPPQRMTIDEPMFRSIFEQIARGRIPDESEVIAIAQLGELVAAVDFDDDPEEHAVLQDLTRYLARWAGVPREHIPPLARIPIDVEERRPLCDELASRLQYRELRELAYALAYLILVVDLEVSPVEVDTLEDIRQALVIDNVRAEALAVDIAAVITPGVGAGMTT